MTGWEGSRGGETGVCGHTPLDQNSQNLKTLTVLTVIASPSALAACYWVAEGLGMLAMATLTQAGLPLLNARSRAGPS